MAFTFNLNADTQLRIRRRDESSNGSILLKTADGILECVGCTEQFQERYTGDNWEFHYLNKTYSETIDEEF
jgi:hypothetical protein